MKFIIGAFLFFIPFIVHAQNVGVGITAPVERLEVDGNLKTNALFINATGSPFDFFSRINLSGQTGFRKSHGASGINYIICYNGFYPSRTAVTYAAPLVGEIRMFSGGNAPAGWFFCEGQELKIKEYTAFFSIIGNAYGGTDSTFILPDMRGVVPVGIGTSPSGMSWNFAQKSN